jgi:hypothetical protein
MVNAIWCSKKKMVLPRCWSSLFGDGCSNLFPYDRLKIILWWYYLSQANLLAENYLESATISTCPLWPWISLSSVKDIVVNQTAWWGQLVEIVLQISWLRSWEELDGVMSAGSGNASWCGLFQEPVWWTTLLVRKPNGFTL